MERYYLTNQSDKYLTECWEVKEMKATARWQDGLNLIIGAWLFVSPWIYGITSNAGAAWDYWIVGGLIFLIATWAMIAPRVTGDEWANTVLGAWMFVSPWVFGFALVAGAAWNAWILGAAVVILALWALPAAARALEDQHAH